MLKTETFLKPLFVFLCFLLRKFVFHVCVCVCVWLEFVKLLTTADFDDCSDCFQAGMGVYKWELRYPLLLLCITAITNPAGKILFDVQVD